MLGRTGGLGGVSTGYDDSAEDVSPRALADADSQFIECGALSVHVKEAAPPVSCWCHVGYCHGRFAALAEPCGKAHAAFSGLGLTADAVKSQLQAGEGLSDVGIVLIHGYGSGVFAWRHIMWPLARKARCRVVAFDRPAFGALLMHFRMLTNVVGAPVSPGVGLIPHSFECHVLLL